MLSYAAYSLKGTFAQYVMYSVEFTITLLNHNQPKSDITDYSRGVVWPSVIQAQPTP